MLTNAAWFRYASRMLRPETDRHSTGDLLRRDADGHIYFGDRLGDTFRSVYRRAVLS